MQVRGYAIFLYKFPSHWEFCHPGQAALEKKNTKNTTYKYFMSHSLRYTFNN